jgi:hypothetical protein
LRSNGDIGDPFPNQIKQIIKDYPVKSQIFPEKPK